MDADACLEESTPFDPRPRLAASRHPELSPSPDPSPSSEGSLGVPPFDPRSRACSAVAVLPAITAPWRAATALASSSFRTLTNAFRSRTRMRCTLLRPSPARSTSSRWKSDARAPSRRPTLIKISTRSSAPSARPPSGSNRPNEASGSLRSASRRSSRFPEERRGDRPASARIGSSSPSSSGSCHVVKSAWRTSGGEVRPGPTGGRPGRADGPSGSSPSPAENA